VLAHELSHVSQRHIARSIGSAGRQGALGVAAMLLGVLVAARSRNPDAAQAAIAGGQAAMMQGQLNFSRDMEREADRIGYGVFRDAGFAAPGMAAMFEKLDQASRLNDSGGFPYLRSHPLTSERMAEARSRLTDPSAATGTGRDALHELMQARARALMDPSVDQWRRLVTQAQSPGGAASAGALYAGALAAARLGDHRTAAVLSEDLVRTLSPGGAGAAGEPTEGPAPDALRSRQAAQLLVAELALARADPSAALTALSALTSAQRPGRPASPGTVAPTRPAERSLLMLRSEATVATALKAHAQADRSQDIALRETLEALQTWVAEHRDDATAWLLLAQASDALGLQLRALRAQAEARAAVGDLDAAIDRLRAAQARSRTATGGPDFIEASIIDTRLRELQTLRRQEMEQARSQRGP
jgi:predicted Zn-dependent protease